MKNLFFCVLILALVSCKKDKKQAETGLLTFKVEGLTSNQTLNLSIKSNAAAYASNTVANTTAEVGQASVGDKVDITWISSVKRSQNDPNNGKLTIYYKGSILKEFNGLILVNGVNNANDYVFVK